MYGFEKRIVILKPLFTWLKEQRTTIKTRRLVRKIAKTDYNQTVKSISKLAGSKNLVFRFILNSGNSKIIKIRFHSKNALMNEQRWLKLLINKNFRVAEVEKSQEVLDSKSPCYFIMPELSGQDLVNTILMNKNHGLNILESLLADVVNLRNESYDSYFDTNNIPGKEGYVSLIDTVTQGKFNEKLAGLHEQWIHLSASYVGKDLECVTHGDFHAFQIIVNEDDYWILDWEDLRLGRWQHDIGSMIASIGAFSGCYIESRSAVSNALKKFNIDPSIHQVEITFWILTYAFAWILQREKNRKWQDKEKIELFLEAYGSQMLEELTGEVDH